MNARVLNRDFQHPMDGYYQVVPAGTFKGRRGDQEIEQIVDGTAIYKIVRNFREESRRENFPGLLVDYEHFSYDSGKSSEAAGWITDLQERMDGVWARIRWSDAGRAAVTNGRYRLVSPVWLARDVEDLGGGRVRPLRLDSVALTNSPNMKGMVPLSNRDLAGGDMMGTRGSSVLAAQASASRTGQEEFSRGAGASSAAVNNKNNEGKKMKSVATKLGLSADASEEAVLAEVTKITNRVTELDGQVVPMKSRITELETANRTLLSEQIDGDLEAAGVKEEKVRNRLRVVLGTLTNRQERTEFLKDLQVTPGGTGTRGARPSEEGGRVLNRADAKQPGTSGDTDERERSEKIKNRAMELQGQNAGRSWDACWAQAQKEIKV